ncbi:MAG: ADP-glyceromanno-heptose 6-epimerase [Caulobacteraceae bacterium]
MTNRLILVTGGAGFIGSNILARLGDSGAYDLAVCDRFGDASLAKWRNIAKHPVADIVAPEALADWLQAHRRELAAIVHMGAISATTEPDIDSIVANNFVLSRDIWRFCVDQGVRLIYASSAATYGDGGHGFSGLDDVASLAALRPLNAYGWSKAAFDLYAVRNAAKDFAPPQWVGLKFFNVYGPNEYHKGGMKSVAAHIWPRVAAGDGVSLFKSHRPDYVDGGQLRDFVYVLDAADVVAWLLATPSISGIYNLGSGQARSFQDLAVAVFKAIDRDPAITFADMPAGLRDQYQYFTQADMSRLRAAGYDQPFTSLEDGMADYVGRFLSQSDPYR